MSCEPCADPISVEHVTPLLPKGADRANRISRQELRRTVGDLEQARTDLAKVVKARAVSTASGTGETAEQLIEAADRALYRGKKAGRARIAIA